MAKYENIKRVKDEPILDFLERYRTLKEDMALKEVKVETSIEMSKLIDTKLDLTPRSTQLLKATKGEIEDIKVIVQHFKTIAQRIIPNNSNQQGINQLNMNQVLATTTPQVNSQVGQQANINYTNQNYNRGKGKGKGKGKKAGTEASLLRIGSSNNSSSSSNSRTGASKRRAKVAAGSLSKTKGTTVDGESRLV
jgi:hypothetical protein